MDTFSGRVESLLLELAPAILTLVLGLILVRVPYGSSLGVRTRRTLQGEAHWRYAHGLGSRALLLSSIVLALLSRAGGLSPLAVGTMVVLWLLGILLIAWAPQRKEPLP